jgi:acylphosphatase
VKRIRAIVTGRVQGVWYRAHTQEKAQALGLTGYVRNLPDGTVEIVAQGTEERIEALLDWARVGPPRAAVGEIRVSPWAQDEELESFEVRY